MNIDEQINALKLALQNVSGFAITVGQAEDAAQTITLPIKTVILSLEKAKVAELEKANKKGRVKKNVKKQINSVANGVDDLSELGIRGTQ